METKYDKGTLFSKLSVCVNQEVSKLRQVESRRKKKEGKNVNGERERGNDSEKRRIRGSKLREMRGN